MIVYYNPACSTCRNAAAILDEKGISHTKKEYLKTGLTKEELIVISERLGSGPATFIRVKNLPELGLTLEGKSDEDILEMLIEYPQLLQRPILVMTDKAIIGRPAESIRDVL